MVGFQPFWTLEKARTSRFLAAFLPPLFLKGFLLEYGCFQDSFSAFSERAKNDASGEKNAFLVHFLRTVPAVPCDAKFLKQMIKKCPKITKNPAFWRACLGPSSWRGSQCMIFRLLAMEKRVWNCFFRLLVIFRQFLRSQHGLNFGLKMALKSILC